MKLPADIVFKEQPDYLMAFKGQNSVLIEGDRIPSKSNALALAAGGGDLLWAMSHVRAITAISNAMLTFGGRPTTKPIERVTPYRITGNTRYVDPDVAGPGTGTLGDPYRFPESADAGLAAGDGVLIRLGSTLPAQLFNPMGFLGAASGTLANPIVYGVYTLVQGVAVRVSGVLGAVTVDCNNTTVCGMLISGKNYICVDGLRFIRNTNATFGMIDIGGASSNIQILNCVVDSPLGNGIRDAGTGSNNVIEGNRGAGCTTGILRQLSAADTTCRITYNSFTTCNTGIWVFDGAVGHAFGGWIEGNTVDGSDLTIGAVGCIAISAQGGAFRMIRNRCRNGVSGVAWNSSLATAGNFAGALVEDNDTSNCVFGIGCRRSRGVVYVQYNRDKDSGLVNGTFANAERYGRGFEFFDDSTAETAGVTDLVVQYNVVSGAVCWPGNAGGAGTEGVGIALDNNCRNCIVRNNYVFGCDGPGVQAGPGAGNQIYGNVLVDNCVAPDARFDPASQDLQFGQIILALSPCTRIYNNTCVSTGRRRQMFGFVENPSFASPGTQIFGNLFIGPFVRAGALINQAAGNTTEFNNGYVGCHTPVVNQLYARTNLGANSVIGTYQDVNTNSPFFDPRPGGPFDATGVAVPGATTIGGDAQARRTPMGAVHASY